jgi:cytidine deaminase
MEIKSTSTSYTTSKTCPHILPCGMCRLTMSQCPRGWMYKTWDITPIYCGSDKTTADAVSKI